MFHIWIWIMWGITVAPLGFAEVNFQEFVFHVTYCRQLTLAQLNKKHNSNTLACMTPFQILPPVCRVMNTKFFRRLDIISSLLKNFLFRYIYKEKYTRPYADYINDIISIYFFFLYICISYIFLVYFLSILYIFLCIFFF